MAGRGTPPVLVAAREYLGRGWQPVPIPGGQKAPRIKHWQKLRLTEEELKARFRGGENVGLLLGEPSGGLVDVDLDAHEAMDGAQAWLPPTGMVHGRPGKPRSHYWYIVDPIPNPEKLSDTDRTCLVEVRSTGQQTAIPPSIHPSGEQLFWEIQGEPAKVCAYAFRRAVCRVAATALLARHWPAVGSRHEAALAVAGLLARAGWNLEDAVKFIGEVSRTVADEEVKDRETAARSTFQKFSSGQSTTGVPRLAEIVGENVASRICQWLHLVEMKQTRVPAGDFRLTDIGNAQRFAARYADRLRYCHDWGEWLLWDGTRWQRDRLEQARLSAAELVTEMFHEAAELTDPTKRDELWKWARRSEHTHRITAMLREAQPQPAFRVTSEQFDSSPWLLNCRNGTLDLKTGECREHRREDFLTKLAGAPYLPDAPCPRWLQFLDEVTVGRVDLANYLARAVGYALTGITREQVFFLLYGSGENGKSTLLETLRAAFGDYAADTEFKTILEQREYGISNDIARLKGARLVTAKEVARGRQFNEPLLKILTGEDTVTARRLYQEAFEFRPEFKLFLAANHRPVIRDNSHALWRRVRLIPFDARFSDEKKDRELTGKLRAELAGILAWAVRGSQAWLASGLEIPAEVAEATAEYRDEMDVVGRFILTSCELNNDACERISVLYEAFREWVKDNGERFVSKKVFAECLRERGFSPAPSHKAGRKYYGVRLVTEYVRGTERTD